jgi:hypothetical protein
MRISAVATMLPTTVSPDLPFRSEQTSSPAKCGLAIVLLLSLASVLMFPYILLGIAMVNDAAIRSTIAQHPLTAGQLLAGLAFWTALIGFPLRRLIRSLGYSRSIEITNGRVSVEERHLFGAYAWTDDISGFEGLAHHVRASMSSVRHELILVHPDRERSILVGFSARFSQNDIDGMVAALGTHEVPSTSLYKFRLPGVRFGSPMPEAPVPA